MNKISSTQLAKLFNISKQSLDEVLIDTGLVKKDGEDFKLTDAGIKKGGEYKDSSRFGTYIVWPEDIKLLALSIGVGQKYISPSSIGDTYKLSAQKINMIFSELGWIEKYLKGWTLTTQGMKNGGIQKEHSQSGAPFVVWPEAIRVNKSFIASIKEVLGEEIITSIKSEDNDFRSKFEARHRATDGHMVRSKAEMLIDNWLYMAEIVHAYERKLPIEEDMYCDFYIPTGRVYIEYWGYENEPKYLARKKLKQDLYKKYEFNLIELLEEDVKNLDDVLPRMLLKFGVQTY